MAVVSVGFVYYHQSQAERLDDSIDVAGEQRMLTQQMTRFTHQIAVTEGTDETYMRLDAASQRYESNLEALSDGGETNEKKLDPPPSSTDRQLATQREEWGEFHDHVQTILETEPVDPDYEAAVDHVVANEGTLLARSDGVVQAYTSLENSGQYAAEIDVAGRQRMLSQRIAMTVLFIDQHERLGEDDDAVVDARADLQEYVDEYDAALAALEAGGAYDGRELQPAPAPVQNEIDDVRSVWDPYRDSAFVVATTEKHDPAFVQSYRYIQGNSDPLLKTSDETVQSFTMAATRQVRAVQAILLILVIINTGVFIAGSYLGRRHIGTPITDVADAIGAIAEGSLETQLSEETAELADAGPEGVNDETTRLVVATERMEAYLTTVVAQASALATQDFDAPVLEEDIPGEFGAAIDEIHRDLEDLITDLERSNDLLSKTEQIAHVGGWEYDLRTGDLHWTDGTHRIFDGFRADGGSGDTEVRELTIDEAIDCYHPDDRTTIRSALDRCQTDGTPADEVGRIVTGDGGERWVHAFGEPVRENGDIVAVRGAFLDVTDRTETELELRQYKQAIEGATDLICATDLEDRYLFANPQYCEYHDVDPEQLAARTLEDVFDGGEYAQIKDRVDRTLEGAATRYQMERTHPEKGDRWLDVRYYPLRAADGSIRGVVATMRDVTERKEYERELQLFERAVEQAGHAIMITDVEGTIQYVNPAFEAMTGYTPAEAIGRNPRILNSGQQSDAYYRDLWETILAGEPWEAEITNQRKSGELYRVEKTIAPITNDDGEITHFVGIESDISDQRLRKQRLAVLTRIIRHNLRNELTVIKGQARRLRSALDDPAYEDAAAAIVECSNSLERIGEKAEAIRKVLDRRSSSVPVCHLERLLDALEAEFEEKYPEAKITTDEEDVVVPGTEQALALIVEEAVANAIEHNNRSTPEVTIRVDKLDPLDRVAIEIVDNGPGLPEHEKATLARQDESALQHSSGIGLWLIHWIAAEFGGDVTIDETADRGSVVRVQLPLIS